MHPTLLIGAADWVPSRLPREEYARRLAELWADHPRAAGAIVYGDPHNHAALAYLTHFTPKLESALALIPKEGEARLLVGGGVNMIGAARPLTFVTDLTPLRDAGVAVAEWAAGVPDRADVVVLNIDAMHPRPYASVQRALWGRSLREGDGPLKARMRRKSAAELALMREACRMLSAGVAALEQAFAHDDHVTDCILKAEHAVIAQGAQDVRSLFSVDRGRTLRPFDKTIAKRSNPMPVYLAARHDGYWAETFCSLRSGADELAEQARRIVAALATDSRPGVSLAALRERAAAMRGPWTHHAVTSRAIARPISLSLDDDDVAPPDLSLGEGETWALQIGLVGTDHAAFASAMIAITATGSEMLWSSR